MQTTKTWDDRAKVRLMRAVYLLSEPSIDLRKVTEETHPDGVAPWDHKIRKSVLDPLCRGVARTYGIEPFDVHWTLFNNGPSVDLET